MISTVFPVDVAIKWVSQDLTDDKSILGQVRAWCLMAPSPYLNQCWPRSMTPYGITRPQWVKSSSLLTHVDSCCSVSLISTYNRQGSSTLPLVETSRTANACTWLSSLTLMRKRTSGVRRRHIFSKWPRESTRTAGRIMMTSAFGME